MSQNLLLELYTNGRCCHIVLKRTSIGYVAIKVDHAGPQLESPAAFASRCAAMFSPGDCRAADGAVSRISSRHHYGPAGWSSPRRDRYADESGNQYFKINHHV